MRAAQQRSGETRLENGNENWQLSPEEIMSTQHTKDMGGHGPGHHPHPDAPPQATLDPIKEASRLLVFEASKPAVAGVTAPTPAAVQAAFATLVATHEALLSPLNALATQLTADYAAQAPAPAVKPAS